MFPNECCPRRECCSCMDEDSMEYAEGAAACRAEKTLDANPYGAASVQSFRQWRTGWFDELDQARIKAGD
jgi:hypothetical protein